MPKPGTGRFNGKFSEVLLGKLKALGYSAEPLPARSPAKNDDGYLFLRAAPTDPIDILAIGASTGGIHALGSLFSNLPKRIGVPILITQHLPIPFMGVFARQLAVVAGREVLVAEDGMPLANDRILVAPGDAHLTLDPTPAGAVVRLTHGRSSSGCMPSVDPMFASVGAIFGGGALGVVLTGMGRDGVEGSTKLVACGGSILAQDEGSCAVWGMPRAVLEAGLASAVLPPEKIARRIASRTEEPPRANKR
jgi:two-component system chemotaxis response regulator CheB